eukprot:TRINITY_DN13497_c0_g1_i11.p1 TRINITY_DN13497_c0_g1~~TRINITY_DN13497_c0_g1_i11.p1  ORF type:complete len:151 (+),score=53.18 TRINITY_DN13497_c0_g1_i11:101-553(+)
MSIHYVIIARDARVILADYSTDNSNYQVSVSSILPKLQANRRRYFQSENCRIFTYCTDTLQFVCLTDIDYRMEAGYSFLEAVKQALSKKFSDEEMMNALTVGPAMSRELKDLVEEYNQNPESDKAKLVTADLIEVKDRTAESLGKSLGEV